ncbi:MAG: GNAT family N-acetyltransferase [Candidatus Azambacteria bacterium]|nr:GNAT family N-acetyltransferase [Candidatus Azambacteria bacterium]
MITFRPHTRDDIPFRVIWLNNKKATKYTLDNPDHKTTVKEQSQWFDNYEQELRLKRKKFFTILYDNRPVGFMGLSNINPKKKIAEIFILIGDDGHRGKGIGKFSIKYLIEIAFKKMGLERLKLEVNKLNYPAIKLYENLGFQKTGENETEIKMILQNSNLA